MIPFLLLLLLALNACSAHVDFSTPYHLKTGERIAVALDPALANKVESSSFMMEDGTYALAPALAYVIENRPDAPIKIE